MEAAGANDRWREVGAVVVVGWLPGRPRPSTIMDQRRVPHQQISLSLSLCLARARMGIIMHGRTPIIS